MSTIQIIMLYFSTVVSIFFLIAGGWTAIRTWIKTKGAAKAAAIEAQVQARVEALQAKASAEEVAAGTNADKTTSAAAAVK